MMAIRDPHPWDSMLSCSGFHSIKNYPFHSGETALFAEKNHHGGESAPRKIFKKLENRRGHRL
jgi:hypothetical protein